MLNNMYSHSTT